MTRREKLAVILAIDAVLVGSGAALYFYAKRPLIVDQLDDVAASSENKYNTLVEQYL